MNPEAASVAAQFDHRQDDPVFSEEDCICVQCHRIAVVPLRFGSRVCEHCLFGLALAPLDSESAAADADAPVQTILNRALGVYVLIEEIGRGGMGVIYRAVHRETSAVVAVKTVLPEHANCEETLARFRREAGSNPKFGSPAFHADLRNRTIRRRGAVF